MKNSTRAMTLIEIIIVLVLSGILLLGACQLIISHFRFSITLQTGMALTQEVNVILEDIKAKVSRSKYVEINTATGEIYLYDLAGKTGTYTIPGVIPTFNATTGYTWSGCNSISYNSNLLSNKLHTLTLAAPHYFNPPVNTMAKVLRISISAQDPKFPNVGPKTGTTTAYCRLPGAPKPVRLVIGSTNNPRTSPAAPDGLYDTIQSAINAATSGDTVQVSSNDKNPYQENLGINKSVILRGTYDYNTWQTSIGDPAYETIIDGQLQDDVIHVLSPNGVSIDVTIEGFTVINGGTSSKSGGAFGVAVANLGSCVISKNVIKQNRGGGLFVGTISVNGSTYTITGNTIAENTLTTIMYQPGGIYADFSSGGTNNINIYGNTIRDNSNAPGLYLQSYGGTVNIYNNTITHNTNDRPIYYQCGGIEVTLNSNATSGIQLLVANNKITNNSGCGFAAGNEMISYLLSYSNVTISNNLIKDNTSYFTGGVGIHAYGLHSTFQISNNAIENNHSIIPSGGIPSSFAGGGIYLYSNNTMIPSGPLVQNNMISGNSAGTGGGIYINSMRPVSFKNNTVIQNTATNWFTAGAIYTTANVTNNIISGNGGAGLTCLAIHVPATVSNNLITNNTSGNYPGYPESCPTVYVAIGGPTPYSFDFSNNTVADNTTMTGSGGFYVYYNGLKITNSIVYNNSPANLVISAGNTAVNYSDIQGYNGTGTGNTGPSVNPSFVGGSPYDYHLQNSSLCKNAGDPGLLDPDGSPSDMGAYGGPGAPNPNDPDPLKRVLGCTFTADATTTGLADVGSTATIREDIIGTY